MISTIIGALLINKTCAKIWGVQSNFPYTYGSYDLMGLSLF